MKSISLDKNKKSKEITGHVAIENHPRVAFLFTGQGSQYPNMGKELYESQSTFRKALVQCDQILREYMDQSIISLMFANENNPPLLNQTVYTQPVIFALEYALALMWQSWGIKPAMVMGHSVGEYVAACIAGVLSLEDGLKMTAARGRLMQALPEGGAMAAIFADENLVTASIKPYEGKVNIAAVNDPGHFVISGVQECVGKITKVLTGKGIEVTPLKVSHAFHSPLMKPMIPEFEKIARETAYSQPNIPLVSNISGQIVESKQICQSRYWCDHILNPVKFSSGIETIHHMGCRLFLEIGPKPTLSSMGRRCLKDNSAVWLPSLKKDYNDWEILLESLGKLFIHGARIDWQRFGSDYLRHGVPLITHSPGLERHWFKEKKDAQEYDAGALGTGPGKTSKDFHPSYGTRIYTPHKDILYEYTCSSGSYLLDEHRVYGYAVMSGSVFVSIVIAGVEKLHPKRSFHITDAIVKNPLYVPDDSNVKIQLMLSPLDNNAYTFQVFSAVVDKVYQRHTWKQHMIGTITFKAPEKAAGERKTFSTRDFQDNCDKMMPGKDLYQPMFDSGMQLGHHFKWAQTIWCRNHEALAKMRSSTEGEEFSSSQVPPGLLDSCTQVLLACLPSNNKLACMFLGYDSFSFYNPVPGDLWCHVTLKDGDENSEVITGTFVLFNEKGQVVAESKGFHGIMVPVEALHRGIGKGIETLHYQQVWTSLPLVNSQLDPGKKVEMSPGNPWIIFSDQQGLGDRLAESLENRGQQCFVINAAAGYEKFKNRRFSINPFEPGDFHKLFSGLFPSRDTIYQGIINLFGLDALPPDKIVRGALEDDQTRGVGSALFITQEIAKLDLSKAPRFWMVTRNAQPVKACNNIINLAQAPLWGLGKVIALEHTEFWGGLIDLDAQPGEEDTGVILGEIFDQNNEDQSAYRNGTRYVPRIVPGEKPDREMEELRLDEEACYLVTGGLGGLGLQWAKRLVDLGARRLVLVSRSEPGSKARAVLAELKNKGAVVEIFQADVANISELRPVFDKIRQNMPPLKGVFHFAGVLDDGMLYQQNWDRFVKVMKPKVTGAWNLHLLTKELDPDHFVLFSSAASLLGSYGQGNYASANAFMDALAHYRHHCGLPALAVNWGLWADSGMVKQLSQADLRRWEERGIGLIEPGQGFDILEYFLRQGVAHSMVFPVDWSQYVRYTPGAAAKGLFSQLVPTGPLQPGEEKTIDQARTSILEHIKGLPEDRKTEAVFNHIKSHISEVMQSDSPGGIDADKSLMELGLDSLMITELRTSLRKDFSIDLPFTEFLQEPSVKELSNNITNQLRTTSILGTPLIGLPKVVINKEERFKPFPLTDIQYAYWIGRSGQYELGSVSCHVYMELDIVGLDIERLNLAITRLVQRHEMLRTIILPDGNQKILETVTPYKMKVLDVRGMSPGEAEVRLQGCRQAMSHLVHPSETGPMFEVNASLLTGKKTRLHVSFDLIIGDGFSANILVNDLYAFYRDPGVELPPLRLSFRDYVNTELKIRETEIYKKSLEYWRNRLSDLPPAPDLPLARHPADVKNARFSRLNHRLPKEDWIILRKKAAQAGLTPSGLMLAAYAQVLSRWSKSPRFSIMVTLFFRLPMHEQVNDIVGDFTSLIVLSVDMKRDRTFKERARAIQDQLWKDMEHRFVTGVQVLRELNKIKGGESLIATPVVFTSSLPMRPSGEESSTVTLPGDIPIDFGYCISQTPQVWIDLQIMEVKGALVFLWDVVEELFPKGLLQDMFGSMCLLLKELTDKDETWDKTMPISIPGDQIERHPDFNHTAGPVSDELLHTLLAKQAAQRPELEAVVTSDYRMSYGELETRARQVGHLLKEKGARPNTLTAVVMQKGWEQVVAVYGILFAGAAYLPIDPSVPKERLWHLLEDSEASIVLTQSRWEETITWPDNHNMILLSLDTLPLPGKTPEAIPPVQQPGDLAYVIYTSGSTGMPKGVMIDHRGAVNTILHINSLFHIGPGDRVLAISNLNFDLSVFDIFGTLAAGGTIVMPDPGGIKEPAHWFDLMIQEKVTTWNSVPALMEMLVEYASEEDDGVLPALRLVLLSGDWIPLDLPERIRAAAPDAEVISLGGATEASIWSIYYPIKEVQPGWKSIPYGKPLMNQRFYVLNQLMEECPDWVPGQLYIDGIGLSLGYWHDEEKTQKSFIIHPTTGERLYRTGDFGRYLPDGNIEFLGREDLQVKIRGHRIELGEIEENIKHHPGIHDAIVTVMKDEKEGKSLVGCVIPKKDYTGTVSIFETIEGDPGGILSRWSSIKEAGLKAAEEVFSRLDVTTFAVFWEYLEKFSVSVMCHTFNRMGVFTQANEHHTGNSLLEKCNIDTRYHPVIFQWLDVLKADGWLKQVEPGGFINPSALTPGSFKDSLARILEKCPDWEKQAHDVEEFFHQLVEHYPALLKGKVEPLELFFSNDLAFTPESLMRKVKIIDCTDIVVKEIMKITALREETGERETPLRILEILARAGSTTSLMLSVLPADVSYTVTDNSTFFINIAKEKFNPHEYVECKHLDIDEDPENQGFEPHSFDIVVAGHSLHLAAHLDNAVKHIQSLLAPNGMLLIVETTRQNRLQLIIAALLEQGFSRFKDERARNKQLVHPVEKWRQLLSDNGFTEVVSYPGDDSPAGIFGIHVLVARASSRKKRFQPIELRHFLEDQLPDYMVPRVYKLMETFPLTPNGKVDRKALSQLSEALLTRTGRQEIDFVSPRTSMEKNLVEIWQQVFKIDSIGIQDNFFALGGDSLLGTQLITRIRKSLQVEISLRDLFRFSTIEQLGGLFQELTPDNKAKEPSPTPLPTIVPDPGNKYEPFLLSDVQQAYWIGRLGLFELSKVSTHTYFEIEGIDLDVQRLELAWRRLISYHDMMRAVVLANGQEQRILKEVPPYRIQTMDLRDRDADTAEAEALKLREEMSHQVLPTDSWPLFDIRACVLKEGRVRLYVSFDNIIFDGWSMLSLFKDWSSLYQDPTRELKPLALGFRDYMLAVRNLEGTELINADQQYWFDRLADLPPAPELPLAQNPASINNHRFRRLQTVVPAETWKILKEQARQQKLTPSGFLLAAYSEVLNAWSKSPRFSINLTLFNRLPLHPQVKDLIGDFTSLTLLAVDCTKGNSFAERAQHVQEQLWQDLDHPYISGIKVLREYIRVHNLDPRSAAAPVVFTSVLGMEDMIEQDGSGITQLGEIVYSITQTPQVWLDHQVYENSGNLVLIWDAVDRLFPPGLLETMFEAYSCLLRNLAHHIDMWHQEVCSLVYSSRTESLAEKNILEVPISDEMLHTLFETQVKKQPDHLAIVAHDLYLTYRELYRRSLHIGHLLRENQVKVNTLVAVVMEKGWEQIAAVLGILQSGAAYLPIDPWIPRDRLWYYLENGQVDIILTQSKFFEKFQWPGNIKCFPVDTYSYDKAGIQPLTPVQTPDDLAYVIFTSGSTGWPKGVSIDHRGAVNTILDINNRFKVGPGDRVLFLSNLNFDLSVYDIFGLLAAGGTIIVPDPDKTKDPVHWWGLLHRQRVTLWDTVPALMQALVEYAADRDKNLPASLRLVLLSGDWIPVFLPDKIRKLGENARVISLGGATEASIWSILYPIEKVDPQWKSIPYGRPMVNQGFHVYNQFLEECPVWVTGQLYISGIGLARGYWNDKEKTHAAFIIHPRTGKRLYRTGDWGRYLPDGNIEFLGRQDHQVKIRGYRIELGEIESTLKTHPKISDAVVVVSTDTANNQQLVGYIITENDTDIDFPAVQEFLAAKLPDHMLLSTLMVLDRMPLTPNGKVDRKALPQPEWNRGSKVEYMEPKNELEKTITAVVREVMARDRVGIKDNFFDIGASSLHIIRIQNKLGKALQKEIPVIHLFEFTTIERLARYLSQEVDENRMVKKGRKHAEIRKEKRTNRKNWR
jgi:yersiniabactin nonribosomal peptide synthetase